MSLSSLKIAARTDRCLFKITVLFFMRALSEQKGYRTIESALEIDESGRERSCKTAPSLNSPGTRSAIFSLV